MSSKLIINRINKSITVKQKILSDLNFENIEKVVGK